MGGKSTPIEVIESWLAPILVIAFLAIVILYLFRYKVAPEAYLRSGYVIRIKLRMIVAIAVPIMLLSMIFGIAYWLGGLFGLLIPLLILIAVFEYGRISTRAERLYSVSIERAPALHKLVADISDKIGLQKTPEILLCCGCRAFTCGWRKPKVALGVPLFDYLSVGEIKAVIAHEFGHIKNRDYVAGAFFTLVINSLRHAVSGCERVLRAGGNIMVLIIMGLGGLFARLLQALVETMSLLFMRQGEFMADLHTTVFETEEQPTNFKHGLARSVLLANAEIAFEKRVLNERIRAQGEGQLLLTRLLEKPHLRMFYEWLHRINFTISEGSIEEVAQLRTCNVGRWKSWGSTHPLVGDRIHNLEVLMSGRSRQREELSSSITYQLSDDVGFRFTTRCWNVAQAEAKSLIQETYDDAVKFLYGYQGVGEDISTIGGDKSDSGRVEFSGES